MLDHRKTLCDLLGQEHSVSDDVLANSVATFQREMVEYKQSADAEIQRLTNSTADAERLAAGLATEKDLLVNSNKSLTEELVGYDLERFAGVIANKAEVKDSLLNNRSATVKTLSAMKVTDAAPVAAKTPLHNSKTAATPATVLTNGAPAGAAENISEADATKVMNRARELQKTGKFLNFQSAVMAARGELIPA